MPKKLQADWFDVFMRVPIKRQYVPYSQSLATLAGLKADNVRVLSLEVKQHGYIINTTD